MKSDGGLVVRRGRWQAIFQTVDRTDRGDTGLREHKPLSQVDRLNTVRPSHELSPYCMSYCRPVWTHHPILSALSLSTTPSYIHSQCVVSAALSHHLCLPPNPDPTSPPCSLYTSLSFPPSLFSTLACSSSHLHTEPSPHVHR